MLSLLIEITRTIEAYRATDPGATIDRIVLAGTAGVNREVALPIEQRFGSPTDIFNLPESLRWRDAAEDAIAPFSSVVGLALSSVGDTRHYFDFLHPKEIEAERRQRVRRRPLVAATAAVFIAAAGVAAYQPIQKLNEKIAAQEVSIKDRNKNEKIREEVQKHVADLESWQEHNVVWIDLLKRFAEVLPSNQECYITGLELKENGQLKLELVTKQEGVTKKVVEALSGITDQRGNPMFVATSGNKAGDSKAPGYPISDEVLVQVKSLVKERRRR